MDNKNIKCGKNRGGFILLSILMAIAIMMVLYYVDFSTIFRTESRATGKRAMLQRKLLTKINAAIDEKRDINAVQNDQGQTFLHLAAKGGFVRATEKLLDNGADVNARDTNGRTPLTLAMENVKNDNLRRDKALAADMISRCGGKQ